VALLLFSPVFALAQLNYSSVTVTALQTATTTADQAVFSLVVEAPISTSLDAVVSALSGLGVNASSLYGFHALTFEIGQQTPAIDWSFQLTAPLAKLNQTIATLSALVPTLEESEMLLSFSFTGTQSSASAACDLAALIPAARTQAQSIANAAGFNTGALLALSTQTGTSVSLTAQFALGLLLGQGQPNTITVAASRLTTPQPDQVGIVLTVTAPLSSTQDTVTAALAQAAISGATFTGLNSAPATITESGTTVTVKQSTSWSYSLTAPLAKAGDTIALLVAAEQSLAKSNAGFSLSFYTQGLQVSQALQNSQTCSQSGLVSDANAAAQTLAAAAGVSAGRTLRLAGPGTAVATRWPWFDPLYNGYAPAANNCSLTVQYELLP